MSITRQVQQIYLAPIVKKSCCDNDIIVVIEVKNENYVGEAFLHPDDKDFYSEKVGTNIALSRARLDAMYWLRAKIYNQIVEETIHCYRSNGNPSRRIMSLAKQAEYVTSCINDEKRVLSDYLKGQSRAVESVKRVRAKESSLQLIEHSENLLGILDKAKQN